MDCNVNEWRQCWDWPYEVNADGRVRRIGGKELKPWVFPNGYLGVTFWSPGRKKRSGSVHTLVAHFFIGPKPTERHQVAHWDGDKTNNKVENLRWALHKENCADWKRQGVCFAGENNPISKLTDEQVREIRASPESSAVMGRKFGTASANIRLIRRGVSWKHLLP